MGILFFFFKNRPCEEPKESSPKKAIAIITASAIIGGTSYMLQLLGAKALPATVLYPFITGGSIVFSAIAGIIIFKERLSAKLTASVLLCLAGTLMFL